MSWIALLIVLAASLGVLLAQNWRWNLVFLAVQYLGVFWLARSHWPLTMAAAKLVTGWMVCAILGIAQLEVKELTVEEQAWPHGRLFRLFMAGLAWVAALALALQATSWLQLSLPVGWGSLLLMIMGLFLAGQTARPFRVILGLLTLMAGFEILYAAVERSVMVAALLTAVNLGLALTGAYWLSAEAEGTP